MSFADFMRLALYDSQLGYYTRDRVRVGRATNTDFFTATQSPLFGELVAAACTTLVAPRAPSEFTFVEIGAEPSGGIFTGQAHPFAAVETRRFGDPLTLSGPCIVFSNELFDAQPFHRVVFRKGAWQELGVEIVADGHLRECELPEFSGILKERRSLLPASASDNYHLDLPILATDLAAQIASQPWNGLFVAFDYGKSWRELVEETPQGTLRAYSKHQQSNGLLAQPGEQDLTGHICWDWLAIALATHGFAHPKVQPQESFFVRQAEKHIAEITTVEAARFSPRKQSLMQLLHPSHMGQKFQVLYARRDAARD